MRGVVLDAMNTAGAPTLAKLRRFYRGSDAGHRLTIFHHDNYYNYQRLLHEDGFWTAGVLTGESFQHMPDRSRAQVTEDICEFVAPAPWDVVLIANEWNVPRWHPSTYPFRDDPESDGDEEIVRYWNEVAPVLHRMLPRVTLYLGGMYTEADPAGHLLRIWHRLSPTPQGVDYHPYGDSFGEAVARINDIRQRVETSVGVFEWNSSDPDEAVRFDRALARVTEHRTFFCWSDGMVPPLGLRDKRDRVKPTYTALRRSYQHA